MNTSLPEFMEDHKDLLFDLHARGIAYVVVEYCGSGDSGQVDSVTGYRAVRYIAEQHVKEDCGGRIPTVADWFRNIKPESWMSRGYKVDTPEGNIP